MLKWVRSIMRIKITPTWLIIMSRRTKRALLEMAVSSCYSSVIFLRILLRNLSRSSKIFKIVQRQMINKACKITWTKPVTKTQAHYTSQTYRQPSLKATEDQQEQIKTTLWWRMKRLIDTKFCRSSSTNCLRMLTSKLMRIRNSIGSWARCKGNLMLLNLSLNRRSKILHRWREGGRRRMLKSPLMMKKEIQSKCLGSPCSSRLPIPLSKSKSLEPSVHKSTMENTSGTASSTKSSCATSPCMAKRGKW